MIRSLVVVFILASFFTGCSTTDNPAGPSAPVTGQQFIFVNPLRGSDGGSGTQNAPLRTIHKAFSLFRSGNQIELQSGTFSAANGRYSAQTVSGPTTASPPVNYYITGAGRSIQF